MNAETQPQQQLQLAIVHKEGTNKDLNEARVWREARGNGLIALAKSLVPGKCQLLPNGVMGRKGQLRSVSSLRQTVKPHGCDVGENLEGVIVVYKLNGKDNDSQKQASPTVL